MVKTWEHSSVYGVEASLMEHGIIFSALRLCMMREPSTSSHSTKLGGRLLVVAPGLLRYLTAYLMECRQASSVLVNSRALVIAQAR